VFEGQGEAQEKTGRLSELSHDWAPLAKKALIHYFNSHLLGGGGKKGADRTIMMKMAQVAGSLATGLKRAGRKGRSEKKDHRAK